VTPRRRRVLAIGEILWDLLPGGRQLGGAPANFAYHAHALGADARLVTRVGDDPLGHEILERLGALGVSTDLVAVDPAAPTGTVSVELLEGGQPRFTIHDDVAWDELSVTPAALDAAVHAEAVCFGTLGQRCQTSRRAIRALVAASPPTGLRVFDVNLRQAFYSREVIEASLELASVLKVNDDELPVVAQVLGLPGSPDEQVVDLAGRFDLRLVALTRGARGSRLYSRGRWADHPGLRIEVADTVGAGDAFTAALALGCLAGWDLDAINEAANELAAFVCSQPGATPPLPDRLRHRFVNA
jgi:fructokinase